MMIIAVIRFLIQLMEVKRIKSYWLPKKINLIKENFELCWKTVEFTLGKRDTSHLRRSEF